MLARPRAHLWIALASIALTSCQKHAEQPSESGTTITIGDRDFDEWASTPSPPAPRDRVPALTGPSHGMQPGFLDGAFLYASVRAGAIQELIHSVPLSPELSRELAGVGLVLGADPRTDDLLAHLQIDPAARISLSIRPVLDSAGPLREQVEQRVELASANEAEPAPEATRAPTLAASEPLAAALGVHARIHVPLRPGAQLGDNPLLSAAIGVLPKTDWADTCREQAKPSLVCGGDHDNFATLRQVGDGLQLDLLLFVRPAADPHTPEPPPRRTAIEAALAMPTARSIPRVGSLRGDANLLVLAPGVLNLARVANLESASDTLEREALLRYRSRDEALRSLYETERLFDGIKLEARVGAEEVLLVGSWLASVGAGPRLATLTELAEVDADVPALAGLCKDALVCARSRGLPARSRLRPLATGAYANVTTLEHAFDSIGEDPASLLVLLATWPNALASLASFPAGAIEPPDSLVAEQVMGIGERVLGFGFAMTGIGSDDAPRGVAFARMPADDLAALRGMAKLADLISFEPQALALEGVAGSVAVLTPDEPPGRIYVVDDPAASTGRWGWAMIADQPERVAWLYGLARDDGASPIVYAEIPRLWDLLAKLPDAGPQLGYAQPWLATRSLRAQLDIADGAPELRVLLKVEP